MISVGKSRVLVSVADARTYRLLASFLFCFSGGCGCGGKPKPCQRVTRPGRGAAACDNNRDKPRHTKHAFLSINFQSTLLYCIVSEIHSILTKLNDHVHFLNKCNDCTLFCYKTCCSHFLPLLSLRRLKLFCCRPPATLLRYGLQTTTCLVAEFNIDYHMDTGQILHGTFILHLPQLLLHRLPPCPTNARLQNVSAFELV